MIPSASILILCPPHNGFSFMVGSTSHPEKRLKFWISPPCRLTRNSQSSQAFATPVQNLGDSPVMLAVPSRVELPQNMMRRVVRMLTLIKEDRREAEETNLVFLGMKEDEKMMIASRNTQSHVVLG